MCAVLWTTLILTYRLYQYMRTIVQASTEAEYNNSSVRYKGSQCTITFICIAFAWMHGAAVESLTLEIQLTCFFLFVGFKWTSAPTPSWETYTSMQVDIMPATIHTTWISWSYNREDRQGGGTIHLPQCHPTVGLWTYYIIHVNRWSSMQPDHTPH